LWVGGIRKTVLRATTMLACRSLATMTSSLEHVSWEFLRFDHLF